MKNRFSFILSVKKISFIVFFSTLSLSFISAQNGVLKGVVRDANTDEPLIGASVVIKGTGSRGDASDFDGNFQIDGLAAGKYDLIVSYISYQTKEIKNVVVRAEQTTEIDIQLTSSDINLEEVQIVARMNRESENVLLLEQKKAVLATQAVGAKEMSRKGVSDAEGAVTKVSGVSKQEGVKNVFVRGLGDRYNATTLNGFPIPSEDPEYKNIALDFFGTDMMKNIGVNKVYSGSNYADVAGALINIESKELVGEQDLKLNGSLGVNTETFGTKFFKQTGNDYFGFSNKTEPKGDLDKTFGFANKLNLIPLSIQPISHSYGIVGGKKIKIGMDENPLRLYFVLSHNTNYTYTNEIIRNTTTDGSVYEDLNGKKYAQNTNQLLLGNVNLKLYDRYDLTYNLLLIHNNSSYVGNYHGINAERYQSAEKFGSVGYMTRQQTNDNLLTVQQLTGDIVLSKKWKLHTGASYNRIDGTEPDRRLNNFSKYNENHQYLLTGSTGNQQRYFSTLTENDFNTQLSVAYRLKDEPDHQVSLLKIGYQGRYVYDHFIAKEYDMTAPDGLQTIREGEILDLDSYYNQQKLNDGTFSVDKNMDTYDVSKIIHAGFVDATYQLTRKLIISAGVRADYVGLLVDYNVDRGGLIGQSLIVKPFVLPSFNLKYDLNEQHTLRLGMSKTYTLPQSKEISPYKYAGINFRSQGNTQLKPSDNYNIDLKWDWYLNPAELISVTTFYKHILNPISRIEEGGSGSYLTYKNMSRYATIAGVELEVRKNIFSDVNTAIMKINKLSLGLNASYTHTQQKVDVLNTLKRVSKLEGAAPYIANFDITYHYQKNNFSITNTLVANYFSDRIYTIGTLGFKDIIENGVPTLDFVSTVNVNKKIQLKITAKNLLNPKYTLRRNDMVGESIILNQYQKGLNIGVGLTYTF